MECPIMQTSLIESNLSFNLLFEREEDTRAEKAPGGLCAAVSGPCRIIDRAPDCEWLLSNSL